MCIRLQKYCLPLTNFAFDRKNIWVSKNITFPQQTLRSLAKRWHYLTKVLRSLEKLWNSSKSIAFPWQTWHLLAKYLSLLSKVLRSRQPLCSLTKYEFSFKSIAFPSKNFAFPHKTFVSPHKSIAVSRVLPLEKYCVPLTNFVLDFKILRPPNKLNIRSQNIYVSSQKYCVL